MESHKKCAPFIITAGVAFPWILTISLLCTHGSFSNAVNFGPLQYAFAAVSCIGILVLIIAVISLFARSRRRNDLIRPASFSTWIALLVSGVSIGVTIMLSAYIGIPQLVRNGDTPPQLIITESQLGTPEIALAFWTQKKTTNTLEWGLTGAPSQIACEERPSHQHWFRLKELQPGELYEYSVNGNIAGKFRAPPATNKPLRFAASGDPHFGNQKGNNNFTQKMLNYISAPANNFSMLFILGDFADMGFLDSHWKKAFNVISSCSSSVPTCYVIGNHDTLFGGLNLYQDYLCPPQNNDGRDRCLWKRIDNGNIHWLVLDLEWDARLFTMDQQAWLLEQLLSIPQEDWCIVMSHTFYYSSGSYQDGWEWYDNRETIEILTPLFEKYSVDLVLSGHNHHSELLQKNGVTYAVVGAFGGPPDSEREYISPASVWYTAGAYDFADVTVEGGTARIVFRDYNNNELFRTIIKRR